MSTLKNEYRHFPVMKHQVVYFLTDKNANSKNLSKGFTESKCDSCSHFKDNNLHGKIFVDCTLGGAGHSFEIAQYLGKDGALIGIDQDKNAIEHAKKILNNLSINNKPSIFLVKGNFNDLDDILLNQEIPGIDAVLMDLGVSSAQIDTISRGFSFKEDCPLDMRMDPSKQTLNAAKIVNSYGKDNLIRVLRDFSDEKYAREIASQIIKYREKQYIESSWQLVDIIKNAIPAPARRQGGHPAKRTFQALRIEVNRELSALRHGLESAIRWLNPGGRIVVISYHSLEDKIVKDTFNSMVDRCICPPDLPKCVCNRKPILKILTRKAMVPTQEEIDINSRCRSAKLRCVEKI